MSNYTDKLPRRIKDGPRCEHLDDEGNRCRRKSIAEQYLFLDSESYSYFDSMAPTHWVVAHLCYEHTNGIKYEKVL